MIDIADFFAYTFGSIINAFVINGVNLFYVLGGALIIGCILSITFHNKG